MSGRIVGDALGQHGLAGARGADHEDVVAAGGRDLQRALGMLLALDVPEVVGIVASVLKISIEIHGNRIDLPASVQEFDQSGESVHRKDLNALTTAASLELSRGSRSRYSGSLAATDMGSAPLTGLTFPSRESSPKMR